MEKLKNATSMYYVFLGIVILIIIIGGVFIFLSSNNNEVQQVSSNVEKKQENNTNSISIENILKSINDVEEQKKQVNPKEVLRIKSITTSSPNIANGVDLDIRWTNMSDKTIKYITFTAYPVNAVGDIVECEIRRYNKGEFKGQETGPIEKGKGSKSGYVYENAWYNNTIVKATLMQIDIEYMDGTSICLGPTDIEQIIY